MRSAWVESMRDLTAGAPWWRRAIAYPLAAVFVALYLVAYHPDHHD